MPPAGLRKENGKLKINYTFANGETSDVEVNEEIGNLILDSRREESNQDRKERYHCYSLDAAEYEGEDWSDTLKPHTQGDIIKHRKGAADGTKIHGRI